MIEYKVITDSALKSDIQQQFQDFFKAVYGRDLSQCDWEHQFVRSPYENSALFIALNENKIVGSSLMIPQKTSMNGSYYLWTTSAIEKKYRSKGVYANILKKQREYAVENEKDFILAFPNALAYPVVKLFGAFRDLYSTHLVKTTISALDFNNIENSLLVDEGFFRWRFEHKDYLFYAYKEHVVFAKKFETFLDVLAIYKVNELEGLAIEILNEAIPQNIITLASFLKKQSSAVVLGEYRGVYYPINKKIDYKNIKLNLLMSDIF